MHKSGFVNIVGNPNVGKSTLMNALVGERLSIVTAKAQTTRHRIMGIVNGEDYQIVYSDTPGILRPNYKLQESMMSFVRSAFSDADVILYVTDVVEKSKKNLDFINRLKEISTPVLLVINKIDLSNQAELEEIYTAWREILPNAEIFPISAQEKFNLDAIFNRILELIPENEAWYDKNQFTDRNLRFFASEIIREKILLHYSKEVPYCTEVVIEAFKEAEDIYHVEAIIYVTRDSQKGIIIGKGGDALKRIGTLARKDMETFFEKRVFLQIFVKVNPDWREDDRKLRQFGYIQD
ncbi:MAG: GTPase Era [Bacteroidetes bacterium GWE2_39_28]|nr:MAG: GTPase Era [Bacteroidetes bacterium GWE2_39_28]OFY13290.1 MAG: GTPase Era [Bacteroidetes bacterium GWF2_39_10]OFZ11467.1 MAG: GTPase Era [Bacteroidetes bacterium RIFOXYC2_FULL_39_11]HCT94081.1 GTPase Era [Rikenellaceae bacterium]HCV15767.1 GTPase Era [Rikenellaceae bacterium]